MLGTLAGVKTSGFRLLFLRDLGPGEGDFILSIQELEDYAECVLKGITTLALMGRERRAVASIRVSWANQLAAWVSRRINQNLQMKTSSSSFRDSPGSHRSELVYTHKGQQKSHVEPFAGQHWQNSPSVILIETRNSCVSGFVSR